ncbi:hypothetical protein H0H92_003551 [Tricholoma furcatifolium]|nr:hypothetical protein H0H92_003551 [Tricholoma furcatifolium]
MLASFATTLLASWFEEPSTSNFTFYTGSSYIYISPLTLVQDLITAGLKILRDQDNDGLFDETSSQLWSLRDLAASSDRGFLVNFVRRFIIGLPMVGAGGLVYMFLSAPYFAPLQFLARRRGRRDRREQSRDIAAVIIVTLLLVGATKTLLHVYRRTEKAVKRVLLRAEEAILEV